MLIRDEVVARGRRVVLRRKRMADAADEYSWRSDQELARYDAAPPMSVEFADYLRNWTFDLHFTDIGRRSFALEDESGRHIGNVMYYNVDKLRQEAELGISIGNKDHWGRGYGSDAVATAVHFVFEETGLQRLYLHTLDWNLRAQKCFLKVGFQMCGTSWRDGHAFVVMNIDREQMAAPLMRNAVA